MSAGRLNLTIEAGATWTRTLTWRDGDDVLVPLAGKGARMQVRASYLSATVALEITSPTNGIVLTDPGVIVLTISAAQTTQLGAALTKGVYDLEITSGSGPTELVTRLLQGTVQISAEVTRASEAAG